MCGKFMQEMIVQGSCCTSLCSSERNDDRMAKCQLLHDFLVNRLREFDRYQLKKGIR